MLIDHDVPFNEWIEIAAQLNPGIKNPESMEVLYNLYTLGFHIGYGTAVKETAQFVGNQHKSIMLEVTGYEP